MRIGAKQNYPLNQIRRHCYIWEGNHSFEMIRRSKECVINIPTVDLVDKVVEVGNCTGERLDKFEKFGLTPLAAEKVGAP